MHRDKTEAKKQRGEDASKVYVPYGFDENNLHVLETIAAQISVAIFNAQEVETREHKLKEQIRELRIQVDETKRASKVEQIVNTDYFQNLQEKAERIRERKK